MAAKRKKRKLDSVKQTHAKVEKKFQPTTLDQIWGDDGTSEYGTLDYEKYKEKVFDMNMSDLQAHASRVGIVPVDNRNMLTDRLLREFSRHASTYSKPVEASADHQEIPEKIKQILAEGR
jgi:hypothetical protein